MDPVIKIGQPAPDFSLPDLQGQVHKLSQQRGRLVVLDFWSAECPWAERSDKLLLPKVEEWGQDVLLWPIAANANEDLDMLTETANQRHIKTVLHDAQQQVATLYGAVTTPHIFVVDGEGLLRYQGAFDDVTFRRPEPTRNYLFDALAALQAGQQPDPAEVAPYGCTVVYNTV